jgi:hypothetical protein
LLSAEEIAANFGEYKVMSHNCQHLVQEILAKIAFVSFRDINSVKEPGRTLAMKFGGDRTRYKTISQAIIQAFGLSGAPSAPMDDDKFIATIRREQGLEKEDPDHAG